MAHKVLLIDDDVNLLQGLKRQFRKRFDLIIAEGGPQALECLKEHRDVAVVVSDMRMPEMTGLEVLKEIRTRYPDITRIMLTGNADQQTATDAVNEGAIFRFFNKPCDHETLAKAIDDAIRQYKLVTAEKELLEQTLAGTIKFLVDLMSFSNPDSFARSTRIRDWIKKLQPHFELAAPWRLDFAAMLLPMSDLIIPQDVLNKARQGKELSQEENKSVDEAAKTVQTMVQQIPRLEELGDILATIHLGVNNANGQTLTIEARILHVLNDLAKLVKKPAVSEKMFKKLMVNMDEYDPEIFQTIKNVLLEQDEEESETFEIVDIMIGALRPGYTLLNDIRTEDGRLLLSSGSILSDVHIQKLKMVAKLIEGSEAIKVARPKAAIS